MMSKKLHPSVEQFKQFIKGNPKLIQEVKKGKTTLQELFEDWYLLGEDDRKWDPFRAGMKTEAAKETVADSQTDKMKNIMDIIKNIDPGQVNSYINNLSEILATIQGVLAQFQGSESPGNPEKASDNTELFMFHKD
ncbi:YlbD family protein [Bacillaceae bacterium Marseille-Q3522]|nr:YlbD family protein [Bacillaceae bacterium Marseille-Q3522]